jgi:nucleotide-binding universal stress UspA family protein
VAEAILQTAETQQSDLILIGGYGHSPVLEIVLGSAVDQVLRESHRPVLICR